MSNWQNYSYTLDKHRSSPKGYRDPRPKEVLLGKEWGKPTNNSKREYYLIGILTILLIQGIQTIKQKPFSLYRQPKISEAAKLLLSLSRSIGWVLVVEVMV